MKDKAEELSKELDRFKPNLYTLRRISRELTEAAKEFEELVGEIEDETDG